MSYCRRLIQGFLVLVVWLFSFNPVAIAASTGAFEQGIQAMEQSNYQQALQSFTQAIEIASPSAAAYANRCLVQLQLKQYPAAIQDCTQALQQSPGLTEAHLNRGLAYYHQGNYRAAIADATALLQIDPTDFRGYFNRGLANSGLGQHQAAIADYTHALNQHPDSDSLIEIYMEQGLAFASLGQFQPAIVALDRAIAQTPQNDRAYYNRGCINGKQRDYLAAIQDFSQVLRLNPGHTQARMDRAIAYYHLGNSQKALRDLQQAATTLQQEGNQAAYQHTLSLIQQIRQAQDSVTV